LRFITSSNLNGCSIGTSATLVPRKSWTACRPKIVEMCTQVGP
jgi:hypothetical protein